MEHQGERSYDLKLDMLLIVLRVNRQTCFISATIALGTLEIALGNVRLSRRKGFFSHIAELTVVNGEVAQAIIRDSDGQTLAMGEKALAICRRCNVLSWRIRPMSLQGYNMELAKKFSTNPQIDPVTDPQVSSSRSQRAPRWTYPLPQEDIDMLPRRHRQVLLLIDGKRSFGEMCRILNYTPDQLIAILDDLILRNLIYWPRNSEEL